MWRSKGNDSMSMILVKNDSRADAKPLQIEGVIESIKMEICPNRFN